MTVAIGLVCNDGVLVASDSMASNPPTASTVTKVFKLNHCPIVWTASGSVYVIEEIQNALDGIDAPNQNTGGPPPVFAQPNESGLRARLKGVMHPAMRKSYESALASTPFPAGAIAPNFRTDFLIAGYANSTAWLLEFAGDGQINWHTPAGFYALGSGGPFATVAHGFMAHYLTQRLSLEQGIKVAYRAIETTCEVSQGGVRPPVQMAIVDASGPRVFSKEEVDEVGVLVERWKALEADTLRMTAEDAQAGAQGDLPSLEDESQESSGRR